MRIAIQLLQLIRKRKSSRIIRDNNMNRKHYVDNLRWICIVLLIPYHAAMAYNTWGEGNYIFFYPSRVLSSFVVGVSPWYMTLLFVLAGMSARYSLEKRTSK